MKKFITNEMMVHVPLCSHKDPKNVLIISDESAKFEKEINKHTNINFQSVACSLDAISKCEDATFDVVISEVEADALITSQINRVLTEDGLIACSVTSLDNVDEAKQTINTLGQYAKIVMPYHVGGGVLALLASKEYHPTADLILQRSDMLDDLEYYNCDVHIGAFAMGNHIRKEYLGIIKN